MRGKAFLAPSSCRADHAVKDEAEPEINDRAQIEMESVVARGNRERGQQEEINHVAQDDRQQGLEQVDQH